MPWIPVAISFGAVFGALSRYYLTLFWAQVYGSTFPAGTFCVNLSGSLAIGFLSALASQYGLPIMLQKMVLVGFLGAYTTFSSYILETANLVRDRRVLVALLYWLGSPILGLFGVEIGIWLGTQLI
ncbi:MAG: fluoride efflux transporter CrcB [Cyanobacteria bacterium P01_H01_bin.119]